jgi:hypothetical protein
MATFGIASCTYLHMCFGLQVGVDVVQLLGQTTPNGSNALADLLESCGWGLRFASPDKQHSRSLSTQQARACSWHWHWHCQ